MLKDSKTEAENLTGTALAVSGVSRRRLVRAGLAAAPVMLTLKSQSALATVTGSGKHMTCSAWASVKAAGCLRSHTATHVSGTCKGYPHWAGSSNTECDKKFHKKTYSSWGGRIDYSKCVPFEGTVYSDKSLKEICSGAVSTNDSSRDKLAKHCAAMYLNIKVDNNCPLDEPTVKRIWTSCGNVNGSWSPVAGGQLWDRDDCNAYFDYVCGITSGSGQTSTCA